MTAACQRQSIDDPFQPERRMAKHGELSIDEAQIELGIMRNERGVADESG